MTAVLQYSLRKLRVSYNGEVISCHTGVVSPPFGTWKWNTARSTLSLLSEEDPHFALRPPFLFSLFNVRARVPFCLRPEKKPRK